MDGCAIGTAQFICRISVEQSVHPSAAIYDSAVCEIGDFSAFRCPKKIYSYFGFDPVVRQSGNSATADLRMSKHGSPFARRCFYMLALQSVSLRKNGEPKNPVLRAYYQEKCKAKEKMTALGAIIHKLCNIVFAVLRDETPFVLISPREHCRKLCNLSHSRDVRRRTIRSA